VVLLDREQGAVAALDKLGVRVHSLLTISRYVGRSDVRVHSLITISRYEGRPISRYRKLYIGKYPPSPPGGYQPMSFGGKNMKRRREKGENVIEKGRGERTREKGK
jgi:hypothetical protein